MDTQPSFDGGNLQDLIAASDDSVKDSLVGGRGLRDFLGSIDRLTPAEMSVLVDQAIKLLEGFYAHLPLKRAMHAVDPLQRLRLLRRRLPQVTSEIAFHHEMTDIFTSLRDLHTNYILPAHFAQMVAMLPFMVEVCVQNGQRQFVVSRIAPGITHPTFVKGVRLTYWNGIPIDRAIEIAASYHAGSNPAARLARGVAGLTKRAMIIAPPPDEEWVVVGYEDLQGQPKEFRAEWTITGLPQHADAMGPPMSFEAASAMGLDLEGDTFGRINKMLFAQHVVAKKRNIDAIRQAARDNVITAAGTEAVTGAAADAAECAAASAAIQGTESIMPDVFSARSVTVGGRSFAYIRIYTFNVPADEPFVREFIRLIELPEMPKDGLILDVRGNGGGLIWAGERLLQLLTPKTIEPCRVQFINTSQTQRLCELAAFLKQWTPSLSRALETGAAFSVAFPITEPERCNDIGQRYYGPVVLITDALCYSTTDIFAAGFQDHEIGTILGVDNNTGAGGANVWELDNIRRVFSSAGALPPLEPLPKGARMRVALRRTLRVRDEAGTELEDLGVHPDEQHALTRADILGDNPDLIAHAAAILAKKSPIKFNASVSRAGNKLKCELLTAGVDYVDAFVARRPRGSLNIVNNALTFELPEKDEFTIPPAAVDIELRGYARGELICSRRVTV